MSENNKCVHCGADCGKNPIIWNNMKFCCNGCKTVYQILNENKLFKYYEIDNSPGIKIDKEDFGNKYAYLDKEEVKEKLFEFEEGKIAKVKFYVPVIHCASCIWLLEHLHTLNNAVLNSTVNFVKKDVTITFNKNELSLRELVELMASIHYTPEISLESETDTNNKSDKKLLYKLGIAGFVFGNVMLYSLPEYFNGKPLDESLGSFLSYLSYFMSIPVVFFSGNDYLISAYKNIKKRVINIDMPIAIGILSLFFVTTYHVFFGTGQGYSDSLTGLIFFLLLGKFYQGKTYQALSFDRDYKSYFPIAVTKIDDDNESSVLLNEIKKNDTILIRNKELIPTDAILVEGNALIDYSFVTGEANPVNKKIGDFIYAGGRQTGGVIKIKTEKEVKQSHLTKLWNQTQDKQTKKSLTSLVDKVSEYFTLSVISLAILGLVFWFFKGEISTGLFVFTAVLIVACPCALALSIPFTVGNTMRMFGNSGLYIKNSEVIERLTKIDTIVFDKTGTITKPDETNIKFEGTLNNEEIRAIKSLVKQSTHPLSNSIYNFYKDAKYHNPEHFVEMSGRGIFGKVNNLEIRIGSEEFVKGEENIIKKENNSTVVHIEINNKYKGFWSISNKYRDGFDNIINDLKQEFELYLLSGDNDSEKKHLIKYFNENNIIFNQKPQDKKNFIENLQKQGKTVLMTGDGLNDAGALMQSDVALTVANDVYHFSPAGDAILEAKSFKKLSKFIRFTHTSMNIVKISFAISFVYNILGIAYALSGNLSPVFAAILMPISSISVVTFATFVTRFIGNRNI